MSSPSKSRIVRLAPSLLVAAVIGLAGCTTTQAPRAPGSISSGEPREPVQPGPDGMIDGAVIDRDTADGDQALADLLDLLGEGDGGYTPLFMADRDIKRVAVLLPFSHPSAQVRREAEGLLAGTELALFEKAGPDVLILPHDTRGSRAGAEEAIAAAIEEKVDLIVGPLFAENVRAVAEKAREEALPVIAFSNDRSAAGGGAYLISISPEAEVARVVNYAADRGVTTFAFLGPDTDYGRRSEQALRIEAARRGAFVMGSEFYAASNEAPVDEAKRLASLLRPVVAQEPGKVAVLIPERGLKLLAVAPLLPYYDLDFRLFQLMGTGAWNDPSIWREPTLQGGIFAAPQPEDVAVFNDAYQRVYHSRPSDLASLGFDAGALAIALVSDGEVTRAELENRDGYRGVNGLYRFRIDGTVERSLSVMQITPGGAQVIEPGRNSFDPFGS